MYMPASPHPALHVTVSSGSDSYLGGARTVSAERWWFAMGSARVSHFAFRISDFEFRDSGFVRAAIVSGVLWGEVNVHVGSELVVLRHRIGAVVELNTRHGRGRADGPYAAALCRAACGKRDAFEVGRSFFDIEPTAVSIGRRARGEGRADEGDRRAVVDVHAPAVISLCRAAHEVDAGEGHIRSGAHEEQTVSERAVEDGQGGVIAAALVVVDTADGNTLDAACDHDR
mmetsp:Transcript_22348/g.57177  ORF Transcript_22348/g.57177 Transcript_22348/m.57177 type:complete len:229 (-) Transcript_22348:508-1194(-)